MSSSKQDENIDNESAAVLGAQHRYSIACVENGVTTALMLLRTRVWCARSVRIIIRVKERKLVDRR